ncbi:hypothetical protein [Psychroserpens luteus]|uniref:Fibronectin type-III domain-containing protein n=1 Tax=Psychroserpens luteus TaxID=1434066 RepID=A0ABW6A026_9FLAO|nr:hypothetical protein [Psychroserpens luteus]
MKNLIYVFALTLLLFNCSSEDDDNNNPNNIVLRPFSVAILETRMDGANIEWTEAIDDDDDAVTYSIYLDDQLISTGRTSLTYNFTDLDPETSYDGNGGTSLTDFFFVTEPETIILTINARDWIINSFPEAGETREVLVTGFEVPVYELAITDSISSEDNSLYTHEIYNENLSSNLAILKACETEKPTY